MRTRKLENSQTVETRLGKALVTAIKAKAKKFGELNVKTGLLKVETPIRTLYFRIKLELDLVETVGL